MFNESPISKVTHLDLSLLLSQLLEDVVCISKLKNNQRISINSQQRKSIDDYFDRVQDSRDVFFLTKDVLENEIDGYRHGITNDIRSAGVISTWIPHFPAHRTLPNVDPIGYSNTVLDGVARLGKHYSLTLPELYSCQKAYETVPNTQYFFGVAVEILLSIQPSELDQRYRHD